MRALAERVQDPAGRMQVEARAHGDRPPRPRPHRHVMGPRLTCPWSRLPEHPTGCCRRRPAPVGDGAAPPHAGPAARVDLASSEGVSLR